MPDLTGIQFMKIAGNQCKIIVTTAYPDYALDGYEFNITDYLLKPISFDRFYKAIHKLKENALPNTVAPVAAPETGFMFVKSEYKLVRVDFADIWYIESLRDYVAIYTSKSGKLLSLDSLRNMEEKLPSDNFMRVHKSFIVAINNIDYVERCRIVIKELFIPIGDSYQEIFFERIKRT
jgi:DNA-binding LytR/AlgR family response regulator